MPKTLRDEILDLADNSAQRAFLVSKVDAIISAVEARVPKHLNWNREQRKRFSADDAQAVQFQIAYNQAINDTLVNIKEDK